MKRTVFILMAISILFGCATAPKKQIETVLFYPPLPDKPRLQFLIAISNEDNLGMKKRSTFDDFLLGRRESVRTLDQPFDIGSSPGKIYVMDRKHKKIIVIDLVNGTFDYIRQQRLGRLYNPSGLWVTKDDIKYIADMKRKQIVVFDQNNKFLRTYGNKDLFDRPVDVAVYENTMYVSDIKKNKLFILNINTGKLRRAIGERGKEEGQFYKPSHLAVDLAGNVYVTDSFNHRVQKFDPDGNFLRAFGFHGDTVGGFARPKGLSIDREGHLYVVDAAFNNAQIFDAETGSLLLFFGDDGPDVARMVLPAGVNIDYHNTEYFSKFADKDFKLRYVFYVANMFGKYKLGVYGFGEWVGPPLAGE